MKRITKGLVLTGVIALCMSGGAVAAKKMTGSDIINGSLTGKEFKKGSIDESRLAQDVQRKLNSTVSASAGAVGPKGDTGARGPQGEPGLRGPQGPAGPGLPAAFSLYGSASENGSYVSVIPPILTTGGIKFGPFPNGGNTGGTVRYDGLNGTKLRDITELSFTTLHTSADGNAIASPYLRVYWNDDADHLIVDPTECATVVPEAGKPHTYDVTAGAELRVNDDACGANYDPKSWAEVVATHGDAKISSIRLSVGFTGGKLLTAFLTDLAANNERFHFGE